MHGRLWIGLWIELWMGYEWGCAWAVKGQFVRGGVLELAGVKGGVVAVGIRDVIGDNGKWVKGGVICAMWNVRDDVLGQKM